MLDSFTKPNSDHTLFNDFLYIEFNQYGYFLRLQLNQQ